MDIDNKPTKELTDLATHLLSYLAISTYERARHPPIAHYAKHVHYKLTVIGHDRIPFLVLLCCS